MNEPRGTRALGLRTQILLMLLGAAILPLALLGLWLTSSAKRAGEQLLQNHLEESADRFAAAVRTRWEYRRADIALIAENEATRRIIAGTARTTEDSVFLTTLVAGLKSTIPVIELRDSAGLRRWVSNATSLPASPGAGRGRGGGPPPTVRIETPILDDAGGRIGTAITSIALAALIPPDSARPLVPGARVGVRDGATAAVGVPMMPSTPFPADSGRARVEGEGWRVASRRMAQPPLEIAIGAPVAPYVAPFEGAARIGIIALLAVGLAAVALTLVLATRATRPLRDLATASDAVTRGRLDPRVTIAGPSEVRHVGAAFNTMTEHLRRTLDELSRRSALAAVGEFATSLSHDVRNALTAIKVDLERAGNRGIDDPVTDGLVARALNNVGRLETVVAGALRVARRGHAPPIEIDLRVPLREAADSARGAFAAIPASLDVMVPDEPVPVRGDAAALQQMFANLLFNAAQALRPGGQASASVETYGDRVEVKIRDSGVGMSTADLEKLSTPFFSTKPSGTGLGLPIARQIAAAHGGELTIESDVTRGTLLRVRLPLLNDSFSDSEQIILAAVGEEVDAR
jgi:signal transduction histidine kinase